MAEGQGGPSAAALSEELDACLASGPHGLDEEADRLLDLALDLARQLIKSGTPDEALPLVRRGEALATLVGSIERAARLRLLLAAAEGDHEGAIAWSRSAVALVAEHGRAGLYFEALTGLANAYTRAERWREAAAVLGQATVAADAAQRPEYAWPAAAQAAWMHLLAGEPAPAQAFLELALANYARADGVSVSTATVEHLALAFTALANELLADSPRAAGEAARQALALSPGRPEALRVRAHAFARLDDHLNAVPAYRSWLAVAPGNPFAWNNLASSLLAIEDHEAALDALSRAVTAAPEDLRFRLNHATVLARSERFDEAVAVLDEVVRIGERLEERAGTETPAARAEDVGSPLPDTGAGSAAEQIETALADRGAINILRDRPDLAAADAGLLLSRPGPAARSAGHLLRAQLAELRGDLPGALAEYERAAALSRLPSLAHAQLLIRLGRDDEALDVLERLSSRDHDPEAAITVLDDMVRRETGRPRTLAVRGLAHFEAGHPRRARVDLLAAVDAGHDVWRTYLLLGLSWIQTDIAEDASQTIDLQAGLEALGEAVLRAAEQEADPSDGDAGDGPAEAFRTLTWLLDRMFSASRFLESAAWAVVRRQEPPWLAAVPLLRPVLSDYVRAAVLASTGEWREAVQRWERVQAAFEAAGFPVSATRTSIAIADVLLRLHDLDAAATHLDRAEEMTGLAARPLTADLRATDHPLDRVAWMEFEYLYVYGIGVIENANRLRALRVTLTARSGDVAAAADEIGDGSWLFQERDGRTEIAPGLSVTAVMTTAQIVRDAGRPDRAKELLTAASGTDGGATHPGLLATLSTLVLEDFEESTRYLDLADEHAERWHTPIILMMRAQLCLHHGRLDEALALLDGVEEEGSPLEYGLAFGLLRSRAELGRGNADRAADLAVRLIAQAEESRLNLSRWELRMAWSGTTVPAYTTAIRACAAADRTLLAFDFAERARARAFLDEDALADPEVDALTMALRERQGDLLWLEGLTGPHTASDVTRLLALERRYGTRVVPEGLVSAAVRATTGVKTEDILHRLRNDRDALTRELDRVQADVLRRQGVEPVGWRRLHEAVGGAAHIVLFHVFADGGVLLFTSGEGEEPRVLTAVVDFDEIAAVLGAARRGSGFDFRQVDLERLQRVAAPLVEPFAGFPADELIVVIPHGPLHSLPLHVLDVAGVPLGLRNPVCYAPSASVLARRLSSGASHAAGEPVVVGDPAGDLAHARIEAVTVAEQLGVPPILGGDVSKDLVTDILIRRQPPPGLVHVAAHGTLNTPDGAAGIVLGGADASDGRESPVLGPADLRGAKLSAALVTLSCCTSGINSVRPGDELTGLVRSFLTAGAASVIVSQWSVDDLSTSLLMRAFYERLRGTPADGASYSVAHALRDAVRRVRSLTRHQLAEITGPHSPESLGAPDPATARTLRIDSVALSAPADFATARASLATSPDPSLRDAALEAEERHAARAAARVDGEDERFPFRHPHYWAPFVLVGDWRLPNLTPGAIPQGTAGDG